MSTEMQTKVQASPAQSFTPVQTGLLQNKSALCNTPGLVEDSGRDKEKLTLQRSSTYQAGTTTVPRFGHDFSRVSVHSTGPGMIQTKLKINEPGDIYEQEADRVADAVMRMPEPRLQRQVDPEEEEEEMLQAKPLAKQITPLVQVQRQEEEGEEEPIRAKSVEDVTSAVTHDLESRINAIRGGGQPLAESEREFFEPRFGRDLSQVRIHTDTRAAETAQAINAVAYTVEQDVVFGAGQFVPETTYGKGFIAHELMHVVQQMGDSAVPVREVQGNYRGKAMNNNISEPIRTIQRQVEGPIENFGLWTGVKRKDPSSEEIIEEYPWINLLDNANQVSLEIAEMLKKRHDIQKKVSIRKQMSESAESIFVEQREEMNVLIHTMRGDSYLSSPFEGKIRVEITQLLHWDALPDPKKESLEMNKIEVLSELELRNGFIVVEDYLGFEDSEDEINVRISPDWEVAIGPNGIHWQDLLRIERLALASYHGLSMELEDAMEKYEEPLQELGRPSCICMPSPGVEYPGVHRYELFTDVALEFGFLFASRRIGYFIIHYSNDLGMKWKIDIGLDFLSLGPRFGSSPVQANVILFSTLDPYSVNAGEGESNSYFAPDHFNGNAVSSELSLVVGGGYSLSSLLFFEGLKTLEVNTSGYVIKFGTADVGEFDAELSLVKCIILKGPYDLEGWGAVECDRIETGEKGLCTEFGTKR